jgi:hypothetical protein
VSSLPPLDHLAQVARRLDAAGIAWALGGSAMLHALGLADHVRDWDLTTDRSLEDVHAALRDLSPAIHGNSGIHADHKVGCFDDGVEVICRFAFFHPEGDDVIRIPTMVSGSWNGYPVGSPEAWAVAYALMIAEDAARMEKAATLFAWVQKHGDRSRVEAMLEEPLPDPLRRLLSGMIPEMPARRVSS